MSAEQRENLEAILRQSAFPADADVNELRPATAAIGHGPGRHEREPQGCAAWHRHPLRDPRVRLRDCPRHPRERRDSA